MEAGGTWSLSLPTCHNTSFIFTVLRHHKTQGSPQQAAFIEHLLYTRTCTTDNPRHDCSERLSVLLPPPKEKSGCQELCNLATTVESRPLAEPRDCDPNFSPGTSQVERPAASTEVRGVRGGRMGSCPTEPGLEDTVPTCPTCPPLTVFAIRSYRMHSPPHGQDN